MGEIERIRGFLDRARRRATWEAWLRWGALTLTALVGTLLLLALCASHTGPASFWPRVTVSVLIILTVAGAVVAVVGPLRLLRNDRGVARFVGRRYPPLASDLLSAVELASIEGEGQALGTSSTILSAFYASVASALEPVDIRRLVPLRNAARAGLGLAAALVVLVLGTWLMPAVIGHGLGLLMRVPTRFEGALVSAEPLIGDVRLSYSYPAYTKLPRRVVEGSTGDIVALRGTVVSLEATVLRSAREARLLLGEEGRDGERIATLSHDKLVTSFKVDESGSYRVWLAPLLGRPTREARAHRIVAEADQPPRVEIFGPADRLELPTPRPIEVGFSASDDFGLGAVELVYRVDEGAEQRIPLKEAAGARSSQGRTVFEPNLDNVGPGVTVAYHIEAKDADGVVGPKTGSSRTLYVVVQDPRENLDDKLLREKEILEKLTDSLGDRLEALEVAPSAAGPSVDLPAKLALWLSLHEAEESHVAALGRVIDDERRANASAKTVLASLSSIADRLSHRLREETTLLGALRARSDDGTLGASHFDRLYGQGGKHVEELESSVLLLDDLIGRQRLEDLADMARALSDTYKRLQDLLARYQATKDEGLKRQLEREMRDLRARLQQLADKIAALKARNEVPTEFQNMPDLKQAMDRANQFSNLLEKGDAGSLQKALSDLGGTLDEVRKMLDGNAQDFGESRFQAENRTMSEALKKLSDLEGDERSLAGDSGELAGEVEEKMAKERAAELDKFVEQTRDKLERLTNRLQTAAPHELSEDGSDELRRAQDSTRQIKRLLPQREWGEAKKEAERAASSLRRLRAEMDERGKPSKRASAPGNEEFGHAMRDAGGIAQEIASDLEKLIPKASDRMSPEQRARSQGMSQRQKSLGERAEQMAKDAARDAPKAGGLDKAAQELKSVGQQMGDAERDMAKGEPRDGSGKARDAADRLAKLRDSLQDEQRSSSGRNHRDPVRIPGADESKAPREWRQELMDAMREHAPERYNDEVRRYYEELVK